MESYGTNSYRVMATRMKSDGTARMASDSTIRMGSSEAGNGPSYNRDGEQ